MIGKIHWNVESIIKHLVFRVHSFKLFWKTERMRLIFFWTVAGIEALQGILRSWGFRKVFTIMTWIFFEVGELKYCKRKMCSASSLCLLSNFVITWKVEKPKAIPLKDYYFWLISCSAIPKATIDWHGLGGAWKIVCFHPPELKLLPSVFHSAQFLLISEVQNTFLLKLVRAVFSMAENQMEGCLPEQCS